MASGRSPIQRRTAMFVIAGTVLIGGAALLARAPHYGLALTGAARPTQTVTATASATPTLAEGAPVSPGQPAVAGAATQAPATTAATLSKTPAAGKGAAQAPAATPAPAQVVQLTLVDPDGKFNYSVRLIPGSDACTVLNEAKAEGKIASVDIDYSYMSSLHSAYVRQINNFANNWTVKVNGTAPKGCSLASPGANDQITWRYQ
jgi:hypothetical protein